MLTLALLLLAAGGAGAAAEAQVFPDASCLAAAGPRRAPACLADDHRAPAPPALADSDRCSLPWRSRARVTLPLQGVQIAHGLDVGCSRGSPAPTPSFGALQTTEATRTRPGRWLVPLTGAVVGAVVAYKLSSHCTGEYNTPCLDGVAWGLLGGFLGLTSGFVLAGILFP